MDGISPVDDYCRYLCHLPTCSQYMIKLAIAACDTPFYYLLVGLLKGKGE